MDLSAAMGFILATVVGLSAGEAVRKVVNCDGSPDECANFLFDSFKRHCESNPGTCTGVDFKIKDKDECGFPRGSKDGHNCNPKFAECINTLGSFYCMCKNGYNDPNEGNITSSGVNCTDINECAAVDYPCAPDYSICTNTNGSFTCSCVEGYEGDPTDLCNDVNECDGFPCPGGAACTNILGSYTCKCASGYEYSLASDACENVNECESTPNPCASPATCSDKDGSYECTCPEGVSCTNDPCSGLTNCSISAICVTVAHGYTCICPEGYSGNPRGSLCSDINECDLSLADCHTRAECQNTAGSYNCICMNGFQGDGRNCDDIQECLGSSPPSCGTNSVCKNTYGSVQCECLSGFQFASDNVTCEDIDECATVDCGARGSCVNNEGSFECNCDIGYAGIPCSDINECDTSTNLCPENAVCRDTDGSYKCVCDIGYEGDGSSCTDIDECANGFTCETDKKCANQPGTVECQCFDGYSGSPCTNIDECATNPCPSSLICTDTEGSYTCTWPTSCEDVITSGAKISNNTGGVFDIHPESIGSKVEVYCDLETDGGGWTVFQRRMDGSENFYLGWDDYVNGFGRKDKEFWLGLENIYQMTKNGDYELRVDLEDFYGNLAFAKYGSFRIDSSAQNYKLHVSSYSGNAGDSLARGHNGMEFSTHDADHDARSGNCAQLYKGAWWYNTCHYSNLNSLYHDAVGSGDLGVVWYHWKYRNEYLKFTEMKFRRK